MNFAHVNQKRAYKRGHDAIRRANERARFCPCGQPRTVKHVICTACWAVAPALARENVYASEFHIRHAAVEELLRFAATRKPQPSTPPQQ